MSCAHTCCRLTNAKTAECEHAANTTLNRICRDVIALIISLCFFIGYMTNDVFFEVDKITNEQW